MTAQRLPVSVCLIAGNEAARIRRALESVAHWTSEIIVVLNDEVNDGTDKIAAEFGAKVFREPWKGHIAQKNSAIQKAAQQWILGLDADEEVSPALKEEIAVCLKTQKKWDPLPLSAFRAAHFIAGAGFAWRLVSRPQNPVVAAWTGTLGRS